MAKTTAQIQAEEKQQAAWLNAKSGLSFEAWKREQQGASAPTSAAKGYGKRNLVPGKVYTLSGHDFRVFDPATLTDKQQSAVMRMLRAFGILTEIGISVPGMTHQDFYPWIDLLFALERREITEAFFKSATGITLNIHVWNDFSDHDL